MNMVFKVAQDVDGTYGRIGTAKSYITRTPKSRNLTTNANLMKAPPLQGS